MRIRRSASNLVPVEYFLFRYLLRVKQNNTKNSKNCHFYLYDRKVSVHQVLNLIKNSPTETHLEWN